jgi:hypothetical protein
MKRIPTFLLWTALIFYLALWGRGAGNGAAASRSQAQQSQPSAPTLATTVDREISGIEKQLVELAEAMPADKFNFSPENLPEASTRVSAPVPCKSSMSPLPTTSYGRR